MEPRDRIEQRHGQVNSDDGAYEQATQEDISTAIPSSPSSSEGQNKLVFKPDLTLEEVQAENPEVHRGRYHPEECRALQRVAILIPHRHREKHLLYLLEHLHPFLQRQQLEYGIYVIHQVSVWADQASARHTLLSVRRFVCLG
ncbi:Beta-1,4-galactosyltransferase 4, partial [Eschrichtius robustus]|nr:Beta-1,4-galactosyltransferase 4 [Eschrichtius robustus]